MARLIGIATVLIWIVVGSAPAKASSIGLEAVLFPTIVGTCNFSGGGWGGHTECNPGAVVTGISEATHEWGVLEFDIGLPTSHVSFAQLNVIGISSGANVSLGGYVGIGAFTADACNDDGAPGRSQCYPFSNTPLGQAIVGSRTSLISIDVTDFINELIDSGDNWAGFTLDSGAFRDFDPGSHVVFSDAYIKMKAIPAPAAVWLLTSALVGIGCFRRGSGSNHG